jgi:uncharacterized protein YndB with AHSA1/START domain
MGPDVVERSIVVPCSVTTAFQVFTAQLNRWWPKSHSRSGDPTTTILIEPRPDGRLYERTSAGVEHAWGSVIIWEPPQHLAYHWYLGSSNEQPSRVDVHFIDLRNGQTRVDIMHRGPELIGDRWARNSVIYATSWEYVLPIYAAFCMGDGSSKPVLYAQEGTA